jgi:hypothetical protein
LWLEVDGNLERWENGLKAKERCILMTHWLAAANKKILDNDELHHKCFERTGMLIKLKAGPDDEKVKPAIRTQASLHHSCRSRSIPSRGSNCY